MDLVDFDSECDVFYNNSCFKYIQSTPKRWDKSNEACNDIGGYLTSIHSENENEMLANLVKIRNNNNVNTFAWIGLDSKRYINASTWVDGNPVTYRGTLQSYLKSRCILIIATGLWATGMCDILRQRICRKTGK